MVFVAKYVHRAFTKFTVIVPYVEGDEKEYFRTIQADNQHEAGVIARRYERKGYILIGCKEQIGKE